MGKRWKWFLRPGRVVIDMVGNAVPDASELGRYRRPTVPIGVPDGRVTSRCDGALVYERPERRRAAPSRHQCADRCDSHASGDRRGGQRRGRGPAEGRGSDG